MRLSSKMTFDSTTAGITNERTLLPAWHSNLEDSEGVATHRLSQFATGVREPSAAIRIDQTAWLLPNFTTQGRSNTTVHWDARQLDKIDNINDKSLRCRQSVMGRVLKMKSEIVGSSRSCKNIGQKSPNCLKTLIL